MQRYRWHLLFWTDWGSYLTRCLLQPLLLSVDFCFHPTSKHTPLCLFSLSEKRPRAYASAWSRRVCLLVEWRSTALRSWL